MFDSPLVILDLETTGATPARDRITEIGLIEVVDNECVSTWSQIVDPETRIPPFIESLTGISNAMVECAPTFNAIAPDLFERLDGKVLVAHNARFDYGFLRHEFGRAGLQYRPRVLCTAKLSRALFPQYRQHNLDSLIERYGLTCATRHRALADAQVLWQFVRKVRSLVDASEIDRAVQRQLAKPSLPPGVRADILDGIPDTPGVYLFYGENGVPLYVGKSVSLRTRVWSHFAGDHRLNKDVRISEQLTRVEWVETAGELGARLKEAQFIRELLPIHNRRGRRQSSYCGFEWNGSLTTDEPLRLASGETGNANLESLFGLFRSRRAAIDALSNIAARAELCPALLGLEARRSGDAPCFSHQIKHCRGACCGKESLVSHNTRLLQALQSLRLRQWPYRGAIGLRECREDRAEVHVFDRWYYLGTAHDEADICALIDNRRLPAFDPDFYRIAQRALFRPPKGLQLIELGSISRSTAQR